MFCSSVFCQLNSQATEKEHEKVEEKVIRPHSVYVSKIGIGL